MNTYTIEIKPLEKSSRGGELHSINILFDGNLRCEYEECSTTHLARKLAEIHFLIDEIYELACKNNGGIIRCAKKDKINGTGQEDAKCFCDEFGCDIKEIPRRNWSKITRDFQEKVKKIFEDNPPYKM
jgi:hypothetical protein